MSDGITLTDKEIKAKIGAICPICATTKATVKIPRDPASRRFKEPGALIHVDTWGAYSLQAWDGSRYSIKFTDDATRFSWADRMKSRSEISVKMRDFHRRIEKTHKIVIRRYRVDNEFVQAKIIDFMKERGVEIEAIAPYAHHQVGVAERLNRTDREKARAMMQELQPSDQILRIIHERGEEMLRNSTLPKTLWIEALYHAIWLKNRSPTRALKKQGITPWEALHKTKPDLSREKIWGSRAYVTIHPEARQRPASERVLGGKLSEPRGWLGYFVGCESESIYRIWDPEKKKIARISTPRIDDGEGLNDAHNGARFNVEREPRSESDEPTEDDSDVLLEDDGNDPIVERPSLFVSDDEDNHRSHENVLIAMATKKKPAKVIQHLSGEKCHLCTIQKLRCDMVKPKCHHCAKRNIACVPPYEKKEKKAPTKVTPHPSGKKCHHCTTKRLTCDMASPKCYHCTKQNRPCVPVKEMRSSQLKEEKCYRCMKSQYYCDGGHPKCGQCVKYNRHCVSYKKGRSRIGTHGKEGQLKSKKCQPCATARKLCDGERPCSTCIKNGQTCVDFGISPRTKRFKLLRKVRCHRCRKQQLQCNEEKPCEACIESGSRCHDSRKIPFEERCNQCQNLSGWCDGGSPCHRCQKVGRPCTYYDGPDLEFGTTSTRYIPNPEENEGKVAEDCEDCILFDRNCDRKIPCSECIAIDQLPLGQVPKTQLRRFCRYNMPDGKIVRYRRYTQVQELFPGYQKGKGRASDGKSTFDEDSEEEERLRDIAEAQEAGWDSESIHESSQESDSLDEDLKSIPSEYQTAEEDSDQGQDDQGGRADDEGWESENRDEWEQDGSNKSDAQDEGDDHPQGQSDRSQMLVASINSQGGVSAMIAQMIEASTEVGPEPKTFEAARRSPEAKQWLAAMQDEYHSLIENSTWEVVDLPKGRRPLSTRWVFKRKMGPSGTILKHKARFVARGFEQQQGVDFDETYASVVKPPSYKFFFAMQALMGWHGHQMDFKTAFLNGEITDDVFITAPDGYPKESGKVLKLNKGLYGLKQSPRVWYQKLKGWLDENEWTVSSWDSSVFMSNGMFMTVYVDDLNIFGENLQSILQVKELLSSNFKMTDLGEISWYLGMEIIKQDGKIFLSLAQYFQDILDRFELHNIRPVSTPADPTVTLQSTNSGTASPAFKKWYQAMVGSLNWPAGVSRPDIAFATGRVGRYSSNPSQEHMDAVERIYAYIRGTMDLCLAYNENSSQDTLEAFVDSDWGACADTRRSTSGWLIKLARAPISWSSKRQRTVALSSTEAEYMAATEAAKEAVWLKRFINELAIPRMTIKTVTIQIDNNGAMKLTKNPEFHGRTKHIEMRHHFIRELIKEGHVDVARVPTRDNQSDILTKALPRPIFQELVTKMGLQRCRKTTQGLEEITEDKDSKATDILSQGGC